MEGEKSMNYKYYNNNFYNPYQPNYMPIGYQNYMRNTNATRIESHIQPLIMNLDGLSDENNNYRTVLWTGENMQLTLMSIPPKEDIGLEVHQNADQFLKLEEGIARVETGKTKDNIDFVRNIKDGYGILIPAGTWHNITNIGTTALKLYSIYAPPIHKSGAMQKTKESKVQ